MTDVRARSGADRRPVIYAGRFVDQLAGTDLPGDCVVLAHRDALPHKLTGVLDRANTLVFLDLLWFPFDALTDDQWNIPMITVLPAGVDARSLASDLGAALFERLGFFDRIVAPDPATWDELRRRYRWAESQRIPVAIDHPSEVAKTVRTLLASEWSSSATSETDFPDRDPRLDKVLHRVQAAALEPRFAAARGKPATEVPLDVLEVGTGAGRWASSFDLAQTRFVGIDACEDLVKIARANFPEGRFERLGPDLLFPYEDESFDLVFSVADMHHNAAPAKRTLLSEMWRVCRPGGRVLFLEDFVFAGEREVPSRYPTSVVESVDLILEATAGQVVLEHAESLRYPGEELHTGGLISLLRLGVPKEERLRSKIKSKIKSKSQELSKIKKELVTAKDSAARSEQVKSLKKKGLEISLLRNELRAAPGRAEGEEVVTGALPDFVVIGATKCGTTFFYHLLTQHPHIEPAAFKEPHFFNLLFEEGVEWYRRCFPQPGWKDGRKTITGEATPAYLAETLAPERMAKVIPQARLIALLRNPVDRAYSQYHHRVGNGQETLKFEEAIEAEKAGLRSERDELAPYLARGVYVDQLLHWSRFFPKEQMLVLKSEDFFEDPAGTLKVAFDFLGLPDWEPETWEIIPEKRNEGGYEEGMEPATRRRLEEYFGPHNKRLYDYLGKDFGW